MPTVTITPSVTAEQVVGVLRDQFGSNTVKVSSSEPDTIQVHKDAFQRAKVRLRQTGGVTTADVGTSAIGPIGYAISALWFTKKVARAIDEAPQLRASS